ncbi:sensor histidine kinase [Roseateles cellulosilyticus]|uniref:Sensor histidine kinase n=1 Tax=Pelomonas cellulosilytica TaxID=2906762 RepID=A0ABS8XPV4_9BURK|nr:sensor histidine kinase [Pelomonas sp. P8]MCE4553853.1 sensor histidine kinase [Pelomonas sp. P8]
MTPIAAAETFAVPDPARLREQVTLDSLRLFLAQLRGAMLGLAVIIAGMVVAWRDFAPLSWRLAWAGAAGACCLAQLWIGWRLTGRPGLAERLPRWLPVLQACIVFSSAVWGLAPLMVSQGPAPDLPLLLACGFNAAIMFAGAQAPGTPRLLLAMTLPGATLSTLAVALHPGHGLQALGCGVLFACVAAHGYRLQRALQETQVNRLAADTLAEALRVQQQRVHEAERERALLMERQRLMRDIHDGVGSHLIMLLRLAESGADGPTLAELLRGAIDDLRLTIDSLEPLEHDLATLLATLRTRLGHRLEVAGLKLDWAMADMPPLPWLEPAQALQLLRLIQEAMTNVIKHARARTLSLSAAHVGDALEVGIRDDGCGFDTAAPRVGHGLPSMRQRARALGATLQWDSTPGAGTCVTLRLPLHV